MPWLETVAKLPGKALAVSILICFLRGVTKKCEFTLRPSLLKRLNVERKAGYRALRQLEAAGLVTVQRKRGKSPVISLTIDLAPQRG